jgi:hypothetical protein
MGMPQNQMMNNQGMGMPQNQMMNNQGMGMPQNQMMNNTNDISQNQINNNQQFM